MDFYAKRTSLFIIIITYYCIKDVDTNQMDVQAVMKKTCCKSDFQFLVLCAMDKCLGINPYKFKEPPHEVCREEIFEDRRPSNKARHKICDDQEIKKRWIKCIEARVKELALEMKPEYKDNEKLKKLPEEKMKCYKTEMDKVACN